MHNLLEHDARLPKLPVPPLSATISKALAALKPLVTPEEYDALLEEASNALTNDSVKLMQTHLEVASTCPNVQCYLNAINGESYPGVYGALRGDTLPRNPYLVLEEDPFAKTINPPNQAQRAACLINSSLKFVVTMRNGRLKEDRTPKSGTPLTMNCYRNLFGTTRVPVYGALQHAVTIQKYRHINDSRHVLFICNNQFYSLDVLTECTAEDADSKHQLWFGDAELAEIVQSIIDEATAVDRIASVKNGVGAITTQTYHLWKALRLELTQSSPDFLRQIDNALFVVALDTVNSPVSDQEKTAVISHGTLELLRGSNIQVGSCTSRWYDKLQLVVTANAVAGVVWELLLMDSTAILRFISDIFTDLILKLARNINGAENTLFDPAILFVSGRDSAPKPGPLLLRHTSTPEIQNLVHLSETRLSDLLKQHEYKTMTIKLDSHLLSKYAILSDSFMQVGFQIAHYALYGIIANTLEPITTRRFRDARTDLLAVQSDLVASLVKLFITLPDGPRKWESFRACCAAHTAQCRDAMAGRGFERHLGALLSLLTKQDAVDNLNATNSHLPPLPLVAESHAALLPFFLSPAVELLSSPELLISNCGNPAMHLFGIPPATDLGFGIGYILHKDKVVVTVSSKFRQTERFLLTFDAVVNGIKRMLRTKSDLSLEAADSSSRKAEMKRLRLERELRNVDRTHPSLRHPIDIDVGSATDLSARQVLANDAAAGSRSRSGSDSNSERDDDFAYLGGYGYFDVGEVDLRGDEISRNESFMNSRSSFGSQLTSRSNSRQQSHLSLSAMGKQSHHEEAKRLVGDRLHERIAEKFSMQLGSPSPAPETVRSKDQIGRTLKP